MVCAATDVRATVERHGLMNNHQAGSDVNLHPDSHC